MYYWKTQFIKLLVTYACDHKIKQWDFKQIEFFFTIFFILFSNLQTNFLNNKFSKESLTSFRTQE